jgi:hypothetical protein
MDLQALLMRLGGHGPIHAQNALAFGKLPGLELSIAFHTAGRDREDDDRWGYVGASTPRRRSLPPYVSAGFGFHRPGLGRNPQVRPTKVFRRVAPRPAGRHVYQLRRPLDEFSGGRGWVRASRMLCRSSDGGFGVLRSNNLFTT